MRCQICNTNDATIHLTEITDGHRQELHLCEICAAEQGVAIKSQIPINELLSNLLGSQADDEDLFGIAEQKKSCPNCGFNLTHFRNEPLLGCPQDYELFENQLLPLIEKAHGGKTTHCGKVPSKTPKAAKHQLALIALKQKLENAVNIEDYETAAKLRDQINELQ